MKETEEENYDHKRKVLTSNNIGQSWVVVPHQKKKKKKSFELGGESEES